MTHPRDTSVPHRGWVLSGSSELILGPARGAGSMSPPGTVHAEALLSDICNNAMSAGELVCCELQQSGQLPLRVPADACVGRQVLAASVAPSRGGGALRMFQGLLPRRQKPRKGPKSQLCPRRMASTLLLLII